VGGGLWVAGCRVGGGLRVAGFRGRRSLVDRALSRRPRVPAGPGRWPLIGVGVLAGMAVSGGVAGDQHPGHRAVAGQPPTRHRLQRPRPADLTPHRSRAAEEAVQVHGHRQLGPDPTGLGELAALQGSAGQLGQGIRMALAAAAGVGGVGRAGQGFQGGQQGLAGLGFQQPVQGDHALPGR
jgi:hypothetical protein